MTPTKRISLVVCLLILAAGAAPLPAAEDVPRSGPAAPGQAAAPLAPGPQRVYEGESLGEVAFPLGGIGTGTVSLGGRGNLRDWEIFNRPGKGVHLPFTFFALYFEQGGVKKVRVLEGPLQPPYTTGFGFRREFVPGLPR